MSIWKQLISKRGLLYKSGFSNLRAMWYLDLAASTNHPWQEEAGALCQQQFKYSSSEDFRGISFQILILLGQFQIFSFGGQLKYYISELSFKMLLFWGFQVLSFLGSVSNINILRSVFNHYFFMVISVQYYHLGLVYSKFVRGLNESVQPQILAPPPQLKSTLHPNKPKNKSWMKSLNKTYKIPSEMEEATRYNCWNCWHCWHC